MRLPDEVRQALANELVGIDFAPDKPKKKLKKMKQDEREKTICEAINGYLAGDRIERLRVEFSPFLIYTQQVERLKDNSVYVKIIGDRPKGIPRRIFNLIEEYQKRGVRVYLDVYKKDGIRFYSCVMHPVEWSNDKKLTETFYYIKRQKRRLVGYKEIDLKEIPKRQRKKYEEKIKYLKEEIPALEKNYRHIVTTRIKYNTAKVFIDYDTGYGFLYSYQNKEDNMASPINLYEIDIKLLLGEMIPEVMGECRDWDIVNENVEKLREVVNPSYSKIEKERVKQRADRRTKEWERVLVTKGFNPLRYNLHTPIEDIEKGIVKPREVRIAKQSLEGWEDGVIQIGSNPLRYKQYTPIEDIEKGIVKPREVRLHNNKKNEKKRETKKKEFVENLKCRLKEI